MVASPPPIPVRIGRLAVPLAIAISAASCASGDLAVSVSDEIVRPPPDVACASWAAGQPLRGRLAMEADGETAETRVVTDEGNEYVVVWPADFKARSTDSGTLVLVDDRGVALFVSGDEVEFPQVDIRMHAGTAEDPFVAAGIFANQCWVPPPDQFGG